MSAVGARESEGASSSSRASPALGIAVALSTAVHAATYLLSPVLPLYVVALGGTSTQVGMLFSAFSLVAVLLRPMAGAWVDRHGIRRVLLPGVAAVVLVSLGLQAASGPAAIIALMGGMGLGHGLVSMAASVLAASGPAERRGRALSLYYLASPVAMAVAAPVALALARHVGMRANFALVTILGLVLLGLALSPTTAPPRAVRMPTGGLRLWSLGALPLSAILVVSTMGHSALYAFLPLHTMAHGQDQHLGWFFALYSGGLIGFRALLGRGADRWGGARMLPPALGAIAAGFLVLTLPPRPASLVTVAVLLAAGGAVLYPTLVALVVDRVPEAERGLAMGTVSGAWDLGIVVGSLVVGLVVQRASHAAGFAVAAGLTLVALVAFVLAERARAR